MGMIQGDEHYTGKPRRFWRINYLGDTNQTMTLKEARQWVGSVMPNTTAAQQQRRMDRRRCGNCGEPASTMLNWGGQTIAICAGCHAALRSVKGKVK